MIASQRSTNCLRCHHAGTNGQTGSHATHDLAAQTTAGWLAIGLLHHSRGYAVGRAKTLRTIQAAGTLIDVLRWLLLIDWRRFSARQVDRQANGGTAKRQCQAPGKRGRW